MVIELLKISINWPILLLLVYGWICFDFPNSMPTMSGGTCGSGEYFEAFIPNRHLSFTIWFLSYLQEKSSAEDGDLKTSETFGYGYYQPSLYAAPQPSLYAAPPAAPLQAVAPYHTAPFSTVGSYSVSAPLPATKSVLSSVSSGNARSAYGYGGGYKYGHGYGYGSRWGYGSRGSSNEVYRRQHQPIYVAWG